MLSPEDIQKLIEVFATREEVATKKDLELLREDFSNLQSAVAHYVKKSRCLFSRNGGFVS